MALTRITKGVIKPNENYDTHDINSTGIITATGANITGNMSVGGVLTYEDVTSIDSVGLITARNGIDCNGDLDVDGHTNLDNVSIAGITTFTNGFVDLKPGNGGNAHFRILSTGSGEAGIFFDAANGDISGSDYAFIGQKNNLDFVINPNANAGNIDFQRAGTTQLRIDTSGRLGIGTVSPSAPIHLHKASGDAIQKIESSNGAAVLDLRHTNGYGYINYRQDGAETFRVGQIAQFTSYSVYNPNSSLPYQLCVEGNGEVGINTHNPGNTLHLLRNTNHGISLQKGGTNPGSALIQVSSFGALSLQASNNLTLQSGGSQQIFFNRGGTTVAKFDTSSRFGINETSNINGRLHVQHDALAENILYATRYNDQGNDKPILAITEAQMSGMGAPGLIIGNHNRDIHIGQVFDSNATVNTNYTNGIRLTSAGRIGLNMDSPQRRVHIHTTGSGSDYIQFTNDTTGTTSTSGYVFGISGDEDVIHNNFESTNMRFYTAGAERLRIDSSGRVMIGNTSASTQFGGSDDLVIGNTSGAHGITIITQNNSIGRLLFSDSTSSGAATYQGQVNYNHSTEALDLRTYTGGSITLSTSNTERVTINSTGMVGINDATGNARLIVSGNSDTSDADCQIRIYDMDTTAGSQIPSLSFWGGSTQLAYIRGTSSGLRFYTGSSGSMAFSGSFDNNQRLLLGNDSNIQVDSSNPRLQVIGSSDSTAHLSIGNFSASVTPATLSLVKSRGGVGAYTAVQDDDVLGKINFIGADGTDLAEVSGKILVACDAAVANNRVPSRMEFYNTDGAGNLDLNMVLTRDSQLFLTSGATRDAMFALTHNTANDFVFGRTSGAADTGMTIITPSATTGFINFADADGSRQGVIAYKHGSGADKMYFRTNNNQTAMVIDSSQNIGIGAEEPQTELNVIGSISTGRNVARELGTIINVSSSHNNVRVGANVIDGKKNFENASHDWLTQGGSRTNANLTIDLGSSISCDRFVIYNQNEYESSRREVKRFTLEGSNDNSNWTTILDDNAGCSNAHEPNPGWSFRIPADRDDDEEGKSYRYWRFTMKDFHGSDSYGGVCELELYQTSNTNGEVESEVSTHSLVATDVSAEIVRANGQPAFSVSRSGTQPSSGDYSANTTIIFDNDSGGGFFQTGTDPHAQYYNTSNGLFTAPMSGIYFFTTTVLVQNATNNYDLIIRTTARDFYCAPGRKAANAGSTSWSTSGTVYLAFGGEVITYMKKGETAQVLFTTFGGGQIYGSGSWTRFAGYMLG